MDKHGLAFSPDGKVLASAGNDGYVRLWDVTTGKEIRNWQHPGFATALAFSPDGKLLASGSGDRAYVWEAASGKKIQTFDARDQGWVYVILFSTDGQRIIAAGDGWTVNWWDRATGKRMRKMDGVLLGASPDAGLVAIRRGRNIHLVNLQDGEEQRKVPSGGYFNTTPPSGYFTGVLTADGSTLIAAELNTILAIDTRTGKAEQPAAGHTGAVVLACFSKDEKSVITAGDTTVLSWEVGTGKGTALSHFGPRPIVSASLAADRQLLALGNMDGEVGVLPLGGPGQVRKLTDKAGCNSLVALSVSGGQEVSHFDRAM
jgi:WD40 repeat protein